MTRLATLLVLALLSAAGCVAPAETVEEAPVEPAGAEPEPQEEGPTSDAAPPAPDAQEGEDAANGTSTSPPASPTPEPPAEPTPPQPVAYNVSASAPLGWAAAVGAPVPDEAPPEVPREQGATDATRCPNATLVVPEGAATLTISRAGDPVQPDAQGAGHYALQLTAPDGMVTTYEAIPTVADEFPVHLTAPAVGTWLLHLRPVGPAAGALWTLTAEVLGASLAPPASLAFASACAPA